MAKYHQKLAAKLLLETDGTILYGCINGFFVNIRINKASGKDSYNSVLERLMVSRYESANITIYADRKTGIDLKSISLLFETYYCTYRASRFKEKKGGFFLFLDDYEPFSIKPSYIAEFLEFITNYLKENDYYSACTQCRTQDNLSCTSTDGIVNVLCENCLLAVRAL